MATTKKSQRRDPEFDYERYCTPRKALAPVYRMWPRGIGLDPCGDPDAIVCAARVFDIRDGPEFNGLTAEWLDPSHERTAFWNPGYKYLSPWVKRAVEFTGRCSQSETIGLVPPSTDTDWWADGVWAQAAAVCFVRGRFKFLKRGKVDPAPRGLSSFVLHAHEDVRAAAIRRFVTCFATVGQVVSNRDGWGS